VRCSFFGCKKVSKRDSKAREWTTAL